MAAYSMDLRTRVLRDCDAGMASDEAAETYHVSRGWVDRLKQRRRETGEIAPRKQTRWRPLLLQTQFPQLAALIREQPDRTLAELKDALHTAASLPTIWRAVTRLGFHLKKNGTRVRARPPRRGAGANRLAGRGAEPGPAPPPVSR